MANEFAFLIPFIASLLLGMHRCTDVGHRQCEGNAQTLTVLLPPIWQRSDIGVPVSFDNPILEAPREDDDELGDGRGT